MVNRRDVDERETPNSVKTENAKLPRMSQPANKGASRISTSLHYSFNRSFGKTIWKINTCTLDASEGRLSKLHQYQLCSLGKVRYTDLRF